MMDLVEDMMKQVAQNVCGSLVVPYQGHEIDLGHWERLTMIDAVKKYSGVDFRDWKTDEDAIASAKAHNVICPRSRRRVPFWRSSSMHSSKKSSSTDVYL